MQNKENSRQKVKTKIPLPMKPARALPRHLLENKNINQCASQRLPLKTLAQTNVAVVLPSSSKSERVIPFDKEKATISVELEKELVTKNAAMRKNLDWDYNVFKDQSDIIIISDDENDANIKEIESFEGNMQGNSHGENQYKTPLNLPTFNKPLDNIKVLKGRLQYNESVQERVQSPDIYVRAYNDCMNRDYTDYIMNYLLDVEDELLIQPFEHVPAVKRSCVINWMMNVNGPSGNPATVQTACWYFDWYFDSVFNTPHFKVDKLQLVGAACYWIAQKVHGPVVQALDLVKSANCAFTAETLFTYERSVLQTLNFPRQPVVPHEFITYLAWWCNSNHPGEIEVAATFLCMSGIMESKWLYWKYPSVIACAAVRNAVHLLQKNEAIELLENCPLYKAVERKSSKLYLICCFLRRAASEVADDVYDHKAPFEHYGVQPYCIAQKIIAAVQGRSSSIPDSKCMQQGTGPVKISHECFRQ